MQGQEEGNPGRGHGSPAAATAAKAGTVLASGEGAMKCALRVYVGVRACVCIAGTVASTALSVQVQIPPLTPQAPPTPDSMGQISPQSAAAMVAFQYPPASYEASARSAVSPIVSYQQSMSAWGSSPEDLAPFEAEFSSAMVNL